MIKFNISNVRDGSKIISLFVSKIDGKIHGSIQKINGVLDLSWDFETGKSSLTKNTDLILKKMGK